MSKKYAKCTFPDCFSCPFADCVAPYDIEKIKERELDSSLKCEYCIHRGDIAEYSPPDKIRHYCKKEMRLLDKRKDKAPMWCYLRSGKADADEILRSLSIK